MIAPITVSLQDPVIWEMKAAFGPWVYAVPRINREYARYVIGIKRDVKELFGAIRRGEK